MRVSASKDDTLWLIRASSSCRDIGPARAILILSQTAQLSAEGSPF